MIIVCFYSLKFKMSVIQNSNLLWCASWIGDMTCSFRELCCVVFLPVRVCSLKHILQSVRLIWTSYSGILAIILFLQGLSYWFNYQEWLMAITPAQMISEVFAKKIPKMNIFKYKFMGLGAQTNSTLEPCHIALHWGCKEM